MAHLRKFLINSNNIVAYQNTFDFNSSPDRKYSANAMPPLRLLDVDDFKIKRRDDLQGHYQLKKNGQYAVVSHRWTADEINLQDVQNFEEADKNALRSPEGIDDEANPGFAKIARACYIAKSDGIPYVWLDTCCIDKGPKSDVTETSRAIKSMFSWYKESQVCYTFLPDVCGRGRPCPGKRSFKESEWFTRGWTLQELLAPPNLQFFDHHWRLIGTKQQRAAEVREASKIDDQYLGGDFSTACIAVKMSWVSGRRTTYRDDMAYCMLGIFDVGIDVRPGEGESAFLRLQEELVEKFRDKSIFA
ncbi:MAG: hypothetical protein Q9160_000575 [Pyrenula sp. 1 TL-2023]